MRFHINTLLRHTADKTGTSGSGSKDPYLQPTDGSDNTTPSPLQLKVMREMMEEDGLSSFDPDIGQSQDSDHNKPFWTFAFKCFLKLAECGEYPGISLDCGNIPKIKKCMSTYIQTLKKK